MFITAVIGFGFNLAMLRTLHDHGHGHSHGGHGHSHGGGHGHSHGEKQNKKKRSEDSMAVRAAFIHVLGDLVQSIGVIIAGAVIWAKPEYRIADPLCTFVFSIL